MTLHDASRPTPNDALARRASVPSRLLAPVWSTSDRALAVLAHAAIGFGLFGISLVVSVIISLVIWVVSRRRRHVAIHAEQAGLYQLFVLIVNVVVAAGWLAAAGALFGSVVLTFPFVAPISPDRAPAGWLVALWLLAIPLFALWYVGTIALGLIGAARVALGHSFWYPVIGPWARRKHGGEAGGRSRP
jgi:hypothetical protein